MKINKQLLIRKSHRYLGIFIGLQFLGWTISGLYFSWNNIDSVHGDHLRKSTRFLSVDEKVISPSEVLSKLKTTKRVDSIHSIHLIRILDKPVYQISYFSGHAGEGMHHHLHHALADAGTAELRGPLTKDEAILVAKEQMINGALMSGTDYIEHTDGHHEYREKPLPAWAVRFEKPACTVYISAELGSFQSIRHDQWRAFDFLWMFHTMDYQNRDDFNNGLLKFFSVLGLITVLSGFLLFFVSSKTIKKITSK